MYGDISKQAQSAANTFKNSLQYLVDAQNQQKLLDEQSASQRYQNLLNQINQQRVPLQEKYAQDTQAAYINKMLAGKQIGRDIGQLGLNTQGFGVSQMLQNETAYGQNYNRLTLDKRQAVRDIDNQVINATGDYNAGQLELSATYAGRYADLQKYIGEQTQNQYNTVYSQLADARAYEDQLKQIAWENEFKNRQLAEQKRQANISRSGGGSQFTSGAQKEELDLSGHNMNSKVSTNYSPILSNNKAAQWLDTNISKQVIRSGSITVGDLKTKLTQAYNQKIINEKDVSLILKSFNLN